MLVISPLSAQNPPPETRLDSAAAAWDKGEFNLSLTLYESLFREGSYSELSLYRMAFVHERLRNYPRAIYYLKKLLQEYGGHHTEEKIVQLMQKNGTPRFYTDPLWNDYFLVWNRFGWIPWILFLILSPLIVLHWFLRRSDPLPRWRSRAAWGLFAFMLPALLWLSIHYFLVPERAVIVTSTAFYETPGYGASWKRDLLSTGETVDIVRRSDIWVMVRAGDKKAWVPAFVIEKL